MTIFVQGGSTLERKVPFGNYIVKYASGEKWYGYRHLFGPSTAYSKADETFNFHIAQTGNQSDRDCLHRLEDQMESADTSFRQFMLKNGLSKTYADSLFEGTDEKTGEKGLDRFDNDWWKKSFLSKIKDKDFCNALIDRLNARNQLSNAINKTRYATKTIQGFTITLYKVPDGNLKTEKIDPEEF